MTTPPAPTESGQSGRRIFTLEESFACFFVLFWGAVLLHRFRVEPDDGADIELRLSTPRALDWRASDAFSGPPNALPPVGSRTAGAGRASTGGRVWTAGLDSIGGRDTTAGRLARAGASGLAPPTIMPPDAAEMPARGASPCRDWRPSCGAGVAGVCTRAGLYVAALNPRSAPGDAMAETREDGCHIGTPCGARRLPGARCHQSPGRGCPAPQAIRW